MSQSNMEHGGGQSSTGAGPATLAVVQQKPTVLRLKRRRDLDAPEHLILEVQTKAKKARGLDALLAQFAAVNLQSTQSSGNAGTLRKRRKFLRISTLPPTALKTAEEVELFVREASSEGIRVPVKGSDRQARVLDKGKEQRRVSALEASRAARYQQVRQRRAASGQASAEVAGATSADAWNQVFHVYDIEAVVDDGAGSLSSRQVQSSGATAEEENIMKNYLPMVEEFLGKSIKEEPTPTMSSQTQRSSQTPENAEEDEWVYDVYIPVEGSWDEERREGEAGFQAETPIIEVSEDEDQLYWEMQQDDDDYDSEDSNAENYYAASYPDEEDYEDVDDEDDELQYMYPDMRGARRRHSDGEESYEEVSSEDDDDAANRGMGRRYFV